MKVCLDSSAYIAMEHGNAAVAEILSMCEEVIVPAATFAELTEGNYCRDNAEAANLALNHFLDKENVKFVPAGHAIAFRYAEISRSLRRRGVPIPVNDIWIAASALVLNVPLCTFDQHFRNVPLLEVVEVDNA